LGLIATEVFVVNRFVQKNKVAQNKLKCNISTTHAQIWKEKLKL
jgi:hypothetical protein